MKFIYDTCQNQEKPYIFISYSHGDSDQVYPILAQLQLSGYRFWYDQHIETGTKWANVISDWLTHENCVKFVIFVSNNSITSEYVEDEVNLARKYKKSCLVVYLEDVKLTGSLELMLDRFQSINRYEISDNNFLPMLMKGIPVETVEMSSAQKKDDEEFAKRYKLLQVIGKGGSATLYLAEMISTGAVVTIKVANCSSKEKNTKNVLIHNEKKALARIQSPFIPKIIDFGEAIFDNELKYYLVESFISGKTLRAIRCPLSEAEIIMIILEIARILQQLHSDGNNLVHCDIKPDNIMIDEFNRLYLIDFGGCVSAGSTVKWGTTTFAAPEQLYGGEIDLRSDIYSLGTTMKYLLEKESLCEERVTFKENIERSLIDTVPEVSYLLALIIEKMTDPRMESRFQTVEELINTVEEYQHMLVDVPELIIQKNDKYMATGWFGENDETMRDKEADFNHTAILDLSLSVHLQDITTELISLAELGDETFS